MIEVIIALGIFSMLAMTVAWILITAIRSNAIIWNQLSSQSDGRRVMTAVSDVIRRVETSSIGSYPIERADDYELIVFANVDSDTFRERVRFYIDTGTNILYRGVTKPTGDPLIYNPSNEVTVPIAYFIVNDDLSLPLFTYYDESYQGTGSPLAQPVAVTDIHVIRTQLEIEQDPTKSPVPLRLENTIHIRNLKTN